MAYTSLGKKPNEYASKSSHHHIINDSDVKEFLLNCDIPYSEEDFKIGEDRLLNIPKLKNFSVEKVITVDGGYQETYARKGFPSSMVAFFQFGVNLLELDKLHEIDNKPFISPKDMEELRNLERSKLILPLKNISYKGESFLYTTRKAIYDFFKRNELLEVVYWFIFEDFSENKVEQYKIEQNPVNKNTETIIITKSNLNSDFIMDYNGEVIFITDVFRLHEVIDEDFGSTGILGYLTPLIEQFFIIKFIKIILDNSPSFLDNVLFIRDGFLGFSGQTARLHKSMRNLVKYLFDKHNLFLVGIEKSGAFVEHANLVKNELSNGNALILTNNYIYKYIIPKTLPNSNEPYASTSYYSGKLIIKTFKGNILVITIPTESSSCFLDENMKKDWYKNIDIIFNILDHLECNYYDNSILPVALVNKMVSLSNKPSSKMLTHFLRGNIK